MISQNPYSNCLSARLYYYDFLSKESKEGIPESTLQHIDHCPECQAEIDRLKTLLESTDQNSENMESRRNSAITTLLKFHFSYADESVRCRTVKPFLASLADPALQILIPTPITKHLDECESCRADLLTLKDFHLTHKQLCRLGQLLAQKPTKNTMNCSQARQAIPAVASMVFRKTNADVLKHLSTCPDCREELFRYREGLLLELSESATDKGPIPCQAVSPSDLYDYAFPYGIDPSDDEYAEFREPLASHLGGCPTCLAKVQELQKTIYGIAERPESDVVTVYHVDEPAASQAPINFTARLKQTISSPRVKPWLKAGAMVAAVIIIGLTFMFYQSTVEAVSLKQMSRAIDKAKNLHALTFVTNKEEPTQERWVSRSLQVSLLKNEKGIFLSDFANMLTMERQTGVDKIVQKEMPDNAHTVIERSLAAHLNILPADTANAHNKLDWKRVAGDDLSIVNESRNVYDLEWTEKSDKGSPISYKRRYFVDPETSFPNKIEYHRKLSDSDEYSLQSTVVVERISDSDMQAAIENAFP